MQVWQQMNKEKKNRYKQNISKLVLVF